MNQHTRSCNHIHPSSTRLLPTRRWVGLSILLINSCSDNNWIGQRNIFVPVDQAINQSYSLKSGNEDHQAIIFGVEKIYTSGLLCGGVCVIDSRPTFWRFDTINCKCMPVLLYGLECFSVAKHDIRSLDFAVTRFLINLFRSTNINVLDIEKKKNRFWK